jgi:RNA polymerase sigma factor (sigma-70 family)
LRVYAQHILRKRTGLCYTRCRELAEEYAQEACHQIYQAHYPFDVPFEAWAKRITLNCVLERQQRSRDLLDQGTFIHTDVESPILSLLVELSFSEYNPFEYVDWRLILLDAIEELPSEAQRKVILLGFFYGWSTEELSKNLDRSRQAIYNLRDRALKALRSILSFNDKTFEAGCESR